MPGIITFILQIALAGVAAYFSRAVSWWLPLLVFPLLLRLFLSAKGHVDYLYYEEYNFQHDCLFDTIILFQIIIWAVICAVLCYRGFDAWWGIPVGFLIGVSAGGLTCPRGWASGSRGDE